MLIKRQPDLTYADVTPKTLYMGRRNLLAWAAGDVGRCGWAYKKLPGLFAGPPARVRCP